MIDLHLRVDYQGEKFELEDIKGSDLVAFERQFRVALPSLREFTFEHCCFLMWRSMTRNGQITLPFDDEFLDGIEDLEEIPGPLGPGEPPGSPA